jgi:hypothetical protein
MRHVMLGVVHSRLSFAALAREALREITMTMPHAAPMTD